MTDAPSLSDLNLERNVIKVAAASTEGLKKLMDEGVNANLFSAKVAQAIFSAAYGLYLEKVAIDSAVLYDEVTRGPIKVRYGLTDNDLSSLRAVLSEACEEDVEQFNPAWVVRLNRRAAKRRASGFLEASIKKLEVSTEADIDSVIADMGRRALQLADERTDQREDPTPSAQFKLWAAKEHYGLATGFNFYDKPRSKMGLGGMIPGEINAATAPSGEGKSTTAYSIVTNLLRMKCRARWWCDLTDKGIAFRRDVDTARLEERAKDYKMTTREVMDRQQKFKVIYLSTEMVAGRIDAIIRQNLTNIQDIAEIRNGGWTPNHRTELAEWAKEMDEHVYIFDQCTVAADMVGAVAQIVPTWEQGTVGVVIVDHIHNINGFLRRNDQGEARSNGNVFYKNVYEMLRSMARQFHVHVLCFDQVNEATRKEFRSTNNVESLAMKDSGDSYNVVDAAMIWGKSKDKSGAAIGWIKKMRFTEDERVYETPFYFKARQGFSYFEEICQQDFMMLPDRVT